MKMMAWWKATAIASCAVLAAACVVTTSDGDDDGPEDLSTGGTRSGSGGETSTGGDASEGGTSSAAGAENTAGTAGAQAPAGECTSTMDAACAACLENADNGFSADDGTGVWDKCKDSYPCCEESAKYVTCVQQAFETNDIIPDDYEGDGELWCADNVVEQLDLSMPSQEFVDLSSDALSVDADPNCYVDCYFPE